MDYTQSIIYKLSRRFNEEEVAFILDQIEAVMCDYNVTAKSSKPVLVDNPGMVAAYIRARRLEGLSENTLKVYLCKYRDFCSYINKPLLQVTTDDIREYLISLTSSASTVDHTRYILTSLYSWFVKEGYLEKNPVDGISRIKYIKNHRQPLSMKELESIRYTCRNNVRQSAILEFMYSTGCRVGEVIKVTMADIDFEDHETHVLGKGGKHRTVYLSDKAEIALRRYIDGYQPTQWLFFSRGHKEKALTASGIEKMLADIGKEAKLPRKLKPHDIRHTTATHALQKGMPLEEIQSMLGHARIDTTLIYADLDRDKVKTDHRRCIA